MYKAGRVAPDLAVPALRRLLREGDLKVRQDAAEALSLLVPPREAIRAIAKVMRDALEAATAEVIDEKEKSEILLWGTDLLRDLTHRDEGFWPGEDEEKPLRRWFDFVDSLREEKQPGLRS